MVDCVTLIYPLLDYLSGAFVFLGKTLNFLFLM